MISEEQQMIIKTSRIAALALMLGASPSMAFAQDSNSQKSFEVSSLRLNSLPIPTSREKVLGTATDTTPNAVSAPKVRRTASGIRIVGAVYFPQDRN